MKPPIPRRGRLARSRGALADLWEGATRPSLAVSLGTLALLVGQLLGLSLLCTPRRLADLHPSALMGTSTDHGAYASLQAYRLKLRPHPQLGVVITGGSGARDCIQTDRALASQLSQRMGEAVRVHLLASPLQASWETSAPTVY